MDAAALTKFIEKKSLPLVGQKTWRSNERYEKAGLPVVTLFTKVSSSLAARTPPSSPSAFI